MNNPQKSIKVKMVGRSGTGERFLFASQCPGGEPRWGNCEFTSRPSARDYDWYVALDDVPHIQPGHVEHLNCPRSNTMLITTEPSSVTRYGKAFAAQFGTLLTNQEGWALPHPNAIRSQTGNLWFYGRNFDELDRTPPLTKSLPFSTVCSAKRQAHTMHARRYDFTQKLKAEVPELEIFGHGVRYIEHKSEALDPYKFHLTIENHAAPHVWTEKLADAFLAYTVPIYCGCPNVFEYFPKDSIIPIDITDFEGSLRIIRHALTTEGEYERRLEAVIEARRRVMYDYNLPAMIDRIITTAKPSNQPAGGAIYSRRVMRARHPGEFLRYAAWRTGNFLQAVTARLRDTRS